MHSLSFKEYYSYGGDYREQLQNYYKYGSLPEILQYDNSENKAVYLRSLNNQIYIKDIKDRIKKIDVDILENLLKYIASEISNLTNPNNIATALSKQYNQIIYPTQISNYLKVIEDSFLVSEVRRYDVAGMNYFKYPFKYYFEDMGIRNSLINFFTPQIGPMVENVVYNNLIIKGYKVDVGVITSTSNQKKQQNEIDFIINDFNKRCYLQVADSIQSEEKMEQEKLSLKQIKSGFKKIIIRPDIDFSTYDEDGIYHMSLKSFLLDNEELF